jgi:hypothetical protein
MGRHAAVLLAIFSLVAAACGTGDEEEEGAPAVVDGPVDGPVDEFGCPVVELPAPVELEVGVVQELPDNGNGHEACSSGYDRSPPTSGDHFDAWQNCDFYTEPVRIAGAVHALEHGAVWIAYQPDLSTDDLAAIEAAVAGETHLLAAPYPGLANPIVLSAWTRQVAVDSWSDPAVAAFLGGFVGRLSTTAPEAGVRCDGGFGVAPDQPDAGFAEIFEAVS